MGVRLRIRNWTYSGMKTLQGGKPKIFAHIKGQKGLHVRIGHFVAQTLQ